MTTFLITGLFASWFLFSLGIYLPRRAEVKRVTIGPYRCVDDHHTERIKTNFNLIALIMNVYDFFAKTDWKNKLKPLSDTEKEIREKKREIKELKKQKADMKLLEELEQEREELFEEVNETPEGKIPCCNCGSTNLNYIGINRDDDYVYRCKKCNTDIFIPINAVNPVPMIKKYPKTKRSIRTCECGGVMDVLEKYSESGRFFYDENCRKCDIGFQSRDLPTEENFKRKIKN